MKQLILKTPFLLVITLAVSVANAQLMSPLTEESEASGVCSYYDHYESVKQCGVKGYPLAYGKKYCEKFASARGRFSPSGKQWLDGTMVCLIEELDKTIEDESMSCKKIKRLSISHHAHCYTDNGFCRLKMQDRMQALRVVLPELQKLNFYRGFFASAKLCKDRFSRLLHKKNKIIENQLSQADQQELNAVHTDEWNNLIDNLSTDLKEESIYE